MDDKDVLTGSVHVSKVLATTKGPLAVLLSAPVLVPPIRWVTSEEVIPWGAGLVEE